MAKKSVIIATDFGVEEAEIISPRDALTSAGINVTIASNSGNDIQTVAGDKDWASTVNADTTLDKISADDYDLVVLPGGTVNADTLRIDRKAQRILNEFASAHKPRTVGTYRRRAYSRQNHDIVPVHPYGPRERGCSLGEHRSHPLPRE